MSIGSQTPSTVSESTLDLSPIVTEVASQEPHWGLLAGGTILIILGLHFYTQELRRRTHSSRMHAGLLAVMLGSCVLIGTNLGTSVPPANTGQAEHEARITAAVTLPLIIEEKYGLQASNTCDFPLGAAAYDKVCAIKLTDQEGQVLDAEVRVMGDDFDVVVLVGGVALHPER